MPVEQRQCGPVPARFVQCVCFVYNYYSREPVARRVGHRYIGRILEVSVLNVIYEKIFVLRFDRVNCRAYNPASVTMHGSPC